MFDLKNKIRKIGAGFMAGLCVFSMLGTSMGNAVQTQAANTITTENSAFPNADTIIAQAAELLGSPYGWGFKGYTGVYYQGSYSPLSLDYVRNQGVDCSGLVYYTLTHLGYKTSGFSWNNPVPVDTAHWLSVNDNCTIYYGGKTSKVDVEKKNVKSTEHPYWECTDGSTITPGSVVIADNLAGEDHSWIYMGEFDSRNDVINYLRNIGVNESYINSKTVGDGNGDGGKHWRIESNGSEGCVINNRTDGKKSTAMNTLLFNILSFMSNQLLGRGNTVAAIDELYLFLTNMTAIEYIRNGMKRVRKKESSFILASQNVEDFLLPEIKEFTKPLFSIPTYSFLFHPGNISPVDFMEALQLLRSEYAHICYSERGTCVFRCGNERYLLQVHAPSHKEIMFGKAGGR